MEEKIITLPDREQIIKRLETVSKEEPSFEDFYSLVAEHCNSQKIAFGIFVVFRDCFGKFLMKGYSKSINNRLWSLIPRYIDVLIDDKDFASEAIKCFEERRLK